MANTFFREEKKYRLTQDKFEKVFPVLCLYLKEDEYFSERILNVYFDNDDFTLINRSISKPKYKEKLRMRAYRPPTEDSEVFLELKKKYDGVVFKRRIVSNLSGLTEFLNTGEGLDGQVAEEIKYFIKLHNAVPKIFLAYNRLSFVGADDSRLRITIDSDVTYRFLNVGLEYGDQGDKLFDKPQYIVEIKTVGAYPIWLKNILNEHKIYPSSFSKVGEVYKKHVKEKGNV